MALIVRSSAIHAAGCYTTEPIRRGKRIVEYTGPRITKKRGDELYQDRDDTYLFGVGDGRTVIDGHGIAMFINHSCDPNCETDEVNGRVYIYAIRNIAAGEELSYDYRLFDGTGNAICHCGAENCRGAMDAPEEIARRRRRLRRSAARRRARGKK